MRGLTQEQRHAGYAAAALAASMLLPWYQLRTVDVVGEIDSASVSAFGSFSFVEAAILLVAGGVGYLLWARSQRKAFHLPGGDGTVIAAAGAWAVVLLVWRLFDKPEPEADLAATGIQWGFFFALAAAGALTAMGQRLRAAHVPEPPNPAEDERPLRRRRRPVDSAAVTEVLRDRPSWEGSEPEPLAPTRVLAEPEPEEPEPEPQPPPPPDRLF